MANNKKLSVKNNISKIMKERGIKQVWLADKTGMTNGGIHNIIVGKYEPSIKTAMNISNVLNVKFDDLFYMVEREEVEIEVEENKT
jgi:putative transcriptional regulator